MGQRHITHSAAAAVALLCHRTGVQPTGHRLSLSQQTLTCDQAAICSPGLPFNVLHPRNPCNYMDYYSFTNPEVMEG